MSDDLSTKTVLIVDEGAQTHLAERLSREFGRVLYYKEWKQDQPCTPKLIVGAGYAEYERVRHLHDVLDEIDLAVFPDIYRGDLQLDLERRGKRVWGSRKAERYEYDRLFFKEALAKVGLNVGAYTHLVGIGALEHHLMQNDDLWIKTNLRGDGETWHHKSYALSKPRLSALRLYYGPVAEQVEFIADESIPSKIETGFDGHIIADPEGRPLYPDYGFTVFEDKNKSAICAAVPYGDLPEAVRDVNDRFCPLLCERFFRSHFGTEIKIAEDGQSFYLDCTARQSQPPGEIIMECVENLGEVMYHGAVGEMVPLKVTAKYGVQVMLYSSIAWGNYLPVQIAKKSRQWTKLFGSCFVDGVDYCVPHTVEAPLDGGHEEVGCIVGIGDTIEDAYEHLKENCEGAEGFDTEEQMESLSECLRRIKAGEDLGIPFGDEPIPEPDIVLEDATE